MWIRLGGRWRRIPPRRAAVWRHLVELLERQIRGAAQHGPPPTLDAFRYVGESVARSGPRRGYVDDQWRCWWELPRDQDGYLIGDCEDLSTAWMARAALVDRLPVVPVVESFDQGGFHALSGLISEKGQPLSPGSYYAGPAQADTPVIVVDPSYLRGMPDPRRSPACAAGARAEGFC